MLFRYVVLVRMGNLDEIVKKLGGCLILHISIQFLFLKTLLYCQTYEWENMGVCYHATHNELCLLTLRE